MFAPSWRSHYGSGTEPSGTLYFENNLATDAFTPERVEVFRLLSAQMAIALENSLLFEERRRVEGELSLLASASAALSQSLDYEQVLATLGALVVPALADWCLVDVVDGRGLVPAAARHAESSKQRLVEEPPTSGSRRRGLAAATGASAARAEAAARRRRSRGTSCAPAPATRNISG